jgi:opacity protein-like surface antigen
MGQRLMLAAALLGCSAVALAQQPAQEAMADAPVEAPESKVLTPLHADARLSVDTDILLIYVNVSVAADLGLIRLGPGTLGVGANVDVGFCGSFCWVTAALLTSALGAPTTYGQTHFFPSARLTYHFPLPTSKTESLKKVNVYGLLFGGPVFSRLALVSKDLEIVGTDTSFGFGGGVGGQYFFTERVFVGGEVTLRYARGRYTWAARVGSYQLKDSEDTWNLSGLNARLSIGIRL